MDNARLKNAIHAVAQRSDLIVARAGKSCNEVCKVFTGKELKTTIKACVDFMCSLADVKISDIRAAKADFQELRSRIFAANTALLKFSLKPTDTMLAILECEETLFRLLDAGDNSIILAAHIGRANKPLVEKLLRYNFTLVHNNLRKAAGGSPSVKAIIQSLVNPLASAVSTKLRKSLVEWAVQVADDSRSIRVDAFSSLALAQIGAAVNGPATDRKTAIAFMRSLYDPSNPRLDNWHKVIRYVRECRNPSDPHAERCGEIRALVSALATQRRGSSEESVWNSFYKAVQPSALKNRNPTEHMGPVPIPDRSWGYNPQ